MSSCLLCGKTNPPRRRKYCSTKCSVEWFKKKGRKPEGWIRKGDVARAAKQQKLKEYQWYKENWLTAGQLAAELGLTHTGVHHRAKSMDVPGKLVPLPGGGCTCFWPPADVPRFKQQEAPIPPGYITRAEAASLIGITCSTFDTNYYKLIKPDLVHRQTHGCRVIQHLYLKSNVLQFTAQREADRKERAAIAARREKEKLAAAAHRAQEAATRQAARAKATAEAKLQRALQKEAARQRRLQKSRNRIPNRKTNWQLPEEREKRLFAQFPKKLLKNKDNPQSLARHERAIAINKKYARLAASNLIQKLECKNCGIRRPYYDFYYDDSYIVGRTLSKCRVCIGKLSKKKYHANKHSIKENLKKNYRGKFRTLIGTTIKQDISRMRGEYAKELSLTHVWEKIEEHCGYNIDEFVKYFESKFDNKMNWLNHGRGTDQYYWQIDHIIPRSKFVFTDLDDPAFIECWSLSNLQPLSAWENNIKDNPLPRVQLVREKFLEKNSALE